MSVPHTGIIELGSGFHGDLTGRENLEFAWRLHGGDRISWPDACRSIEDFAGIGASMDEPVKHYSSGMVARVALALSLELSPRLLIVDEALSAGDVDLRERVEDAVLEEIVERGQH